MFHLLTNATANGDGTPVESPRRGRWKVTADGTFDGSTVTIKSNGGSGSTYTSLGSDCEFESAGHGGFILGEGENVLANVSNAGASTDVNAKMTYVGP